MSDNHKVPQREVRDLFAELNFAYHEKKWCSGTEIQQHISLEDAKAACIRNNDCTCISDYQCQGNGWQIYKDATIESSYDTGTCAWTKKGIIAPFQFQCRKIINLQD